MSQARFAVYVLKGRIYMPSVGVFATFHEAVDAVEAHFRSRALAEPPEFGLRLTGDFTLDVFRSAEDAGASAIVEVSPGRARAAPLVLATYRILPVRDAG